MQLPILARYVLLLTTIPLAAPVMVAHDVCAAPPGFELDLKELKKPSVPKKPTSAPKTQKKPATATAVTKRPASTKKSAQGVVSPTKPVVAAVSPKPDDATPQHVFLDGTSACPLARQLLEAVAEPVPAGELRELITLPVAAAGRYQGLTAVLVCGLPPAEVYTFRRLAMMHEAQLVNLTGDEQPAQVVQAIAQGLGLSYRQQQEHPLSYLINDAQGRQIRLKVGSGTTP